MANPLGLVAHEPQDQPLIDSEVTSLLKRGWDRSDVFRYVSVMEEVNPDIDEDFAVRRMSAIRAKYPR